MQLTQFILPLLPLIPSALCTPIITDNIPQSNGEIIGDLRYSIRTDTARTLAKILTGHETATSEAVTKKPATAAACKKDVCCPWYDVSADLTKLFVGKTGRCNSLARSAIRLGFHDAGTWSKSRAAKGQDFGGADGSFILFNEGTRPLNRGMDKIVAALKTIQKNRKVGMADLIQYAHNHATVTCPLGGRVRTFVGRKDATRAAMDGLLPSAKDSPQKIIDLFADKTLVPRQLVALMGAHSTARQFFEDPKRAGAAADPTPGVWDVGFYNHTISKAPTKTFKIPSDVAIAKFPATKDEWGRFVGRQDVWNEEYAIAYVRVSMLGVNNMNDLMECSGTLPKAQKTFKNSAAFGFIE